MRSRLLILLAMIVLLSAPSAFATDAADDAEAIEATVKNYVEGWFSSDTERVARALHPNLFKVTVRTTRDGEKEYLDVMEAEFLATLAGGNQDWVRDKKGLLELEIVHQDERFAVVHVVSTGFYDICGLVKLNGEWKILQVLWQSHPPEH